MHVPVGGPVVAFASAVCWPSHYHYCYYCGCCLGCWAQGVGAPLQKGLFRGTGAAEPDIHAAGREDLDRESIKELEGSKIRMQ